MTDYEYIITQCRKYHFTKWDEEELRKCVDKLAGLPREQLVSLYRNKWLNSKSLKESIFNIMFKDQIGKREERIKKLETAALISEFQDKHGGNVALCRKELQERYKAGVDQELIAEAFKQSGQKDQQWVESQKKKVTDERQENK